MTSIPDDIQAELTNIGNSTAAIRNALVAKGVTPTGGLSSYADAISEVAKDPILETVTVAPTTASQILTPSTGVDGFDEVRVNAVTSSIDNNITEGNIKSGVEILGVTGTYTGDSVILQNKTLAVDHTTPTVVSMTADTGYDGLSSVTVDLSYITNKISNVLGSEPEPSGDDPVIKANFWIDSNGNIFNMGEDANGEDIGAAGGVLSASATDITITNAYLGTYNATSGIPVSQVSLSKLEDISGEYALRNTFRENTNVISVDLSGLQDISGSGGLYYTFYGCINLTSVDFASLEDVSGDNGMCSAFRNNNLSSVSFPSLTEISGYRGFSYTFTECRNLSSISFPNLTTISGDRGMEYTFSQCTGLTSIEFPSLTTISGTEGMDNAFKSCINLTSASFPSLTTISAEEGMYSIFDGSKITSITFPSLTTISGKNAMQLAFTWCKSLKSVYFPALTYNFNVPASGTTYTDQFNLMLREVTGCVVHFPSNLRTKLSSWSDVTNGFGGTNTVILYDLPATT